jgi:hypothetical protein
MRNIADIDMPESAKASAITAKFITRITLQFLK